MINIVLYQPEIPPNTGNVIRLAANTGCYLHLIEPLGFSMEEKSLRRAGLDYHEYAQVQVWPDFETFLQQVLPMRLFALSTKGTKRYTQASFEPGDYLLFGPETRGLPEELLASLESDNILRLPMHPNSRSLNLSNSVAVLVYEALRQQEFDGLG
ncbi:rRNA methylase [Nitrincola sp. A-D6]|uniref:tRNA (uridine(34)/cytosine(34)/5- carboxymethylaminomethyluridine(34)-2'-O)- methyltransferase TrmL n=1 Tax=Nitrincola sp. A-D6 TaxID=1545442 RepID=UPI00051F95A9|nr:tRNA (uridine(34)/cytosine(34)/5-carboxymethylaminomethyluridine(34)-2'-O)-methyltransferase TrmL [Nitrincola sp. A-D6]KGK41260.1 rRNA methylase [Nitrincola sp. A-D6]